MGKTILEQDKAQVDSTCGQVETLNQTIQQTLDNTSSLIEDLIGKKEFYEEQIKRAVQVQEFCKKLLGK